ncbi:MAG: energy-coupling factor ABC transporter permease [bacterium]
MHIADGIIATEICVAADAACLGSLYVMGRETDPDEIPRMGFVGAALFAVSLVHFPVAGTAMHLSLLGLAGVLLGSRAVPVLFLALLFQSLIFQHGGLITLGLNTLNMSVGALSAWALWRTLPVPRPIRAFAAGFAGIMLPATLVIAEFLITGYGRGILVLYAAYAVTAVAEGLLTVSVTAFLHRVQPDILEEMAS